MVSASFCPPGAGQQHLTAVHAEPWEMPSSPQTLRDMGDTGAAPVGRGCRLQPLQPGSPIAVTPHRRARIPPARLV